MLGLGMLLDPVRALRAVLYSVTSPDSSQNTASFNQTLCLLGLPAEIRGIIWEYVLGPATYHMVQGETPDSIVHIRCLNILKCDEDGSPCRLQTCFSAKTSLCELKPIELRFFNLQGISPWRKLGHAKLGLLSTCRQICKEATAVFWSTSCIEVFDASLLVKLAKQTDLRYLAMIKTLRLHFPAYAAYSVEISQFFCTARDTWELLHALRTMTALPRLRIALEDPGFVHPDRHISMSGLNAVQLKTVVELMLPEDLPEIAEDLEGIQQRMARDLEIIHQHIQKYERRETEGEYDLRTMAISARHAENVDQELLIASV